MRVTVTATVTSTLLVVLPIEGTVTSAPTIAVPPAAVLTAVIAGTFPIVAPVTALGRATLVIGKGNVNELPAPGIPTAALSSVSATTAVAASSGIAASVVEIIPWGHTVYFPFSNQ
ncbi:hypothetical protein ACU6QD_12400 [Corynebacterium glucuronolyticum]|uniref:hypothetical protein n=1 Tax=Corynebacterium glucuronolyticum TaxID=39791 RepID=UPI00191CE7CD|nr:hypothetical protein I6I68_07155 [Corynebacterium glucuronolyticum]